jgi:hypothetical protein
MMLSQVNRRAIITVVVLLTMWTAGLRSGCAAGDALALKGELRVGLVTSNAALVTRDADGQFRGVAIDLANALAAKLGVPSRIVPYENQTRFNLSLGKDEWDIAIGPRDLSRTGQLAFSDVFMEVDNGYVAKAGVSLRAAQDVDRAGVKVAVAQGSPLDGFLTRTLKRAPRLCGCRPGLQRRVRRCRSDGPTSTPKTPRSPIVLRPRSPARPCWLAASMPLKCRLRSRRPMSRRWAA